MIAVQLANIIFAFGLLISFAMFYDGVYRSMSWFSSPWIIFGIYLCPFYFSIGFVPDLDLMLRRTILDTDGQEKITRSYRVQILLHATCFLLGIISIVMTGMMMKSAYLVVLPVLFYTISTTFNLVFKLIHHGRILF